MTSNVYFYLPIFLIPELDKLNQMSMLRLFGLLLCLIPLYSNAEISVRDSEGNIVTLTKPAKRIISLSPSITELIFAAGGGDRLVGTIKFSDYPEAAKRIPVVGDSRELDLERIMMLKPDLLLVWRQGNSMHQIERLQQLGVPIFFSDAHRLSDIPKNLQRFGQLMGTEQQANKSAEQFRQQVNKLTKQYQHLSPVRLFYQVWDHPLFTLNGQQIVSDAIRLCGGVNVFASQAITAPNVSIEAVLQKNPEVIIGTNEKKTADGGISLWKRYPNMIAVKRNNLFELDGELINRASPRMILGITELCERLDQARKNRH